LRVSPPLCRYAAWPSSAIGGARYRRAARRAGSAWFSRACHRSSGRPCDGPRRRPRDPTQTSRARREAKLRAGARLDRTPEVAGSSPASSIRRKPCIRTALSPRASRIPVCIAEDLQALVPLVGVFAADAGRSEASLGRGRRAPETAPQALDGGHERRIQALIAHVGRCRRVGDVSRRASG
jgi:hypothetical protein